MTVVTQERLYVESITVRKKKKNVVKLLKGNKTSCLSNKIVCYGKQYRGTKRWRRWTGTGEVDTVRPK